MDCGGRWCRCVTSKNVVEESSMIPPMIGEQGDSLLIGEGNGRIPISRGTWQGPWILAGDQGRGQEQHIDFWPNSVMSEPVSKFVTSTIGIDDESVVVHERGLVHPFSGNDGHRMCEHKDMEATRR